jgi:hypothetical protein
MWKITTRGFTLEEVLIMAAMNLLTSADTDSSNRSINRPLAFSCGVNKRFVLPANQIRFATCPSGSSDIGKQCNENHRAGIYL